MEIGFTAPRTTSGSPFAMPPVRPPARFVAWSQRRTGPAKPGARHEVFIDADAGYHVVHVRSEPPCLLEPEPELHALDRLD